MKNLFGLIATLTIIGLLIFPTTALALSPDTNLSSVDASFWGDNSDDFAGYSVNMVGDVNGDGYDDILIGAYGNDDGGNTAGHTYVFTGKASGWSMDTHYSANNGSFIGESYRDYSGWSVADAGDVNGDGFNDILIGAPEYSKGGTRCGRSYLIGGHQAGGMWIENKDIADDKRTTAIFTGEVAYDYSGWDVAGAGDVNGDGYDDILISAVERNDEAGETYLFLGKDYTVNIQTDVEYFDLSDADASFTGEDDDDLSGYAVSGAGDVNGDGYDDILIGAPGASGGGMTYLIHGKASGWSMDTDLGWVIGGYTGENSSDYSGCSVAAAGDVNGDGYDDFLIGSFKGESCMDLDCTRYYDGKVYLELGRSAGWVDFDQLANTEACFISENTDDFLGKSISGAGDVNGDGFDDFIIGASDYHDGDEKGKSYLILGRADAKTAWGMNEDVATVAAASFIGESNEDKAGWSVSGGGDVNGDGFDDLLIGAPYNDEGDTDDAGQAYLIFSDTSGPTSGTYKNFVESGDTPAIHYPGANVTVDFSACTAPSHPLPKGYLTVTEHNNQKPDGVAINRYWSIEPTDLSAYTYDITFKYTDGEVTEAGDDESKLQLYKKVGGIWEAVPGTIKAIANQITATGQTGFSDWALGNSDSPLSVINTPPTLTGFAGVVDTTDVDTEVEITFTDLATQGDEADSDGTVEAFVVKSVSTGSLKIGANAGVAAAYAATTNDTIDATSKAYWTPAPGASGNLNAFAVVAKDDGGLESSTPVTAQVEVTIPLIPTISVTGGPFNFGDIEVGGISALQTYTVEGDDLTNDLVISSPSKEFLIKKQADSVYGNTITLTPSGGDVAITTIDVKLNPRGIGSTGSVNITNTSTGATTENISVQGTGTTGISDYGSATAPAGSGTITIGNATIGFEGGSGTGDITVLFYSGEDNSGFNDNGIIETNKAHYRWVIVEDGTYEFTTATIQIDMDNVPNHGFDDLNDNINLEMVVYTRPYQGSTENFTPVGSASYNTTTHVLTITTSSFSEFVFASSTVLNPVPEILTIVFVAIGLMALGAFFWYRKRRRLAVAAQI